jgi:hypothetical protein
MANLRGHALPEPFQMCCESTCAVKIETVEADPPNGIKEHRVRICDGTAECKSLQKKFGEWDHKPCECKLFKLAKTDPPDPDHPDQTKPAKWEPMKDGTVNEALKPVKEYEDKDFHYQCFCVIG